MLVRQLLHTAPLAFSIHYTLFPRILCNVNRLDPVLNVSEYVDMLRTRSRWMAHVTQQVKKKKTDQTLLPSFSSFFQHTWVQQSQWWTALPQWPGRTEEGALKGGSRVFLQIVVTLNSCELQPYSLHGPQIIQYLDWTSRSVSFTPLCYTLWCALCTIREVRASPLGRSIGCLEDKEILEFCSLPPHLHTWLLSLKRPNCILQEGNWVFLWGGLCIDYPSPFHLREGF